jgi:hypothetical protein
MSAHQWFNLANLGLGSALALVSASPWAGAALTAFALVQPSQDPTTLDQPLTRWILGIAGGVWAGWGAMMVRTTAGDDPRQALRAGLAVWCALDSAASLANGAPANVAVNLTWLAIGFVVTRGGPRP